MYTYFHLMLQLCKTHIEVHEIDSFNFIRAMEISKKLDIHANQIREVLSNKVIKNKNFFQFEFTKASQNHKPMRNLVEQVSRETKNYFYSFEENLEKAVRKEKQMGAEYQHIFNLGK